MNSLKILLLSFITLMLNSSIGYASDYDWTRDFNSKAGMDPSGFRAKLEARFRVGDTRIKAVLGCVDQPSDAYILLRLGEMSHWPIEHVVEKYRVNKGNGWGALAKSLGIKPGSKDFHDLKRGQDIYFDTSKVTKKGKSKENGHGNGKGRGKGKE